MNFFKIFIFDFKNILKNPSLVLANTLLPIILILVMGTITKSRFGAGNVTSYEYYSLNMIIFSVALIAMTASNTFMEEKVKKGNTRIVYAPISKTVIYLSKLLSTYIFGTITYTILILGGQYIFRLNFGGKNIWYVVVLINVFAFLGCSLGILSCCLFHSEEKANAALQLPVALFIFFGGVFFAIHRMGKIVIFLSCISPVKWIAASAFQIIYDNDFHLFFPVVLALTAISFFCMFLCQIVFKPEAYI